MQRFDIKINTTETGFTLYKKGNSDVAEFLKYISQTNSISCFDFNLTSTDPYFYSFTDYPVSKITEILFDSQNLLPTEQATPIQLKPEFIEKKETLYIAQIKIYFDDIIELSQSNIPIQYTIQFSVRSTQWHYFIISGELSNQSDLHIYDKSKPQIRFEGPSTVLLPNGQEALKFSSGDSLIPFSEVPEYQFNLVNKTQRKYEKDPQKSQETILIKGLPNPNPASMSITYIKDKPLVTSPMYVYL
ncbi:MAG: hypothetical protein KDD99_00945 [Bacteroidetes bacterium]|nr:hypothetical protein [Bacteroidota bacterium]